jgi:hypothetical protein
VVRLSRVLEGSAGGDPPVAFQRSNQLGQVVKPALRAEVLRFSANDLRHDHNHQHSFPCCVYRTERQTP